MYIDNVVEWLHSRLFLPADLDSLWDKRADETV